MEPLLVDVLVPTYEPTAEHLRAALESLQAQTYPHWRCTLHDESVVADVREIVAPFLVDGRFTFLKSDRLLGIGGNWNACLRLTHQPVVAYLFHDDRWDAAYLERAVAVLQAEPEVGLVAMAHQYDIEGGVRTGNEYAELQHWRETQLDAGRRSGVSFLRQWVLDGLRPNVIGEPSFCVLRRACMEQVGVWDEAMPQCLDVEYWVRLLQVTDWAYQPVSSGAFRVHVDGTTARNRKAGKGLLDRFEILERLGRTATDVELRSCARQSLVPQLVEMLERALERRRQGDLGGGGGGGAFKQLCLRFPWLMTQAIARVGWRRARG
jgi:glycosyltransferase involved in cell wall biosynthesis